VELIRHSNKHKRAYIAKCINCDSVFRVSRYGLNTTNDREGEYIQTEICTECATYGLQFSEEVEPSNT